MVTGTLTQGYIAPEGETPQTAGDVTAWFGMEKGETLEVVLSDNFETGTTIVLQSTDQGAGGRISTVASLTSAGTTRYPVDKKAWYRLYFLTQIASEEITYTYGQSQASRATAVAGQVFTDEATGTMYKLTMVNGELQKEEI